MQEYVINIVGLEHAVYPSQLECDHGCTYILQLMNPKTDDVAFEFCPLSAEQFAGLLLDAIELCHLST